MNGSEAKKWEEMPSDVKGKRQFAIDGKVENGSIIFIKHPGDELSRGKGWVERNIRTPGVYKNRRFECGPEAFEYINAGSDQEAAKQLDMHGLPPLEIMGQARRSVAALKIQNLSY